MAPRGTPRCDLTLGEPPLSVTTLLKESKELRDRLRPLVRKPELPAHPRLVDTAGLHQGRLGTALQSALALGLIARFNVMRPELMFLDRELRPLWLLRHFLAGESPSTVLPESVARACFDLVALERVHYRRGGDFFMPWRASDQEVGALQQLYALVPWDQLQPKRRILLFPELRTDKSMNVGARGDLLIDDVLVEVKVSGSKTIGIETVRQIVTYALLARRYGVSQLGGRRLPITKLAVFDARGGVLHSFRLWDCMDPGDEKRTMSAIRCVAREHAHRGATGHRRA